MPRIIPIQLLRCLKVLLNSNGGILSQAEVKRISCLMLKYSKKLVSKCIYVQILKCTDTELLDEFMRVGGWNLVFTWLNDGIRLFNWPLVQEIVELLLLCPVDVNRLRTNSAPKTVKGLSNNGGTEAVRILADRLVKQWLKVVTDGNEQAAQARAVAADSATSDTMPANNIKPETETLADQPTIIVKPEEIVKAEPEVDPLYVPESNDATENLQPTVAQKKGMKSGLVYKIVLKDGQQQLTKVETSQNPTNVDDEDSGDTNESNVELVDNDDYEVDAAPNTLAKENENVSATTADIVEEDSTSTSYDKPEDKDSSECSVDSKCKERKTSTSSDTKIRLETISNKSEQEHRRSSKDSKSSKEHKSDKEKERKSSTHRSSSSSHKSSSKNSSSSSSKPKSSSSSSSSHRSSSDKHRSSSSSSKDKEKDRIGSSISSSSSKHHKSSSKSSSSTGSSSKERHRDKDKERSSLSSLSSKKDKEREKEVQAEKDKDTLAKMLPPSLDKLGKIPKKPRDDKEDQALNNHSSNSSSNSNASSNKPTSITIPSKKASISIEIRRDAEKTSAVKTYKSQFRSHGLTEEAPPPPSRKTLKKPSSTHGSGPSQPSTVIPTSLPSALKRPSPPPKDTPVEKKHKIDINSIAPAAAAAAEKPGAIKLIPPKRIQTLVETNLFSDALSAATGPKKVIKRKRPATPANGKDEPTTPTSPDAAKVTPLKFYQDTLDESAKKGESDDKTKFAEDTDGNGADKDSIDDDDDIPLKKVKEDIEQRVRNQKKAESEAATGGSVNEKVIDLSSEVEEANAKDVDRVESPIANEVRKPGPGCGPNGPPGVLMLHRRKGPKKKLTWRPQETLEQIRYFEMDENERCNVMKVSFLDMKNMERFNERASLTNLTKRGPRPGDIQEARTEYRPLIEVDDVPVHPDGANSKERKIQADREMTTLRALYFSPNMIPDSPSEAELEPHSSSDPPVIPLDDITGNQDSVNDFSEMPWPEPKGTPRNNDSTVSSGLGSLSNAADMFGALNSSTVPPKPSAPPPTNPFNNFMHPYGGNTPNPVNNMMPNNVPPLLQMQVPPNGWQGPPPMQVGNMVGNPFQGPPNVDMRMGGGARMNFMGPQSGPGYNGPPPPQFMQGGSPQFRPQHNFVPNVPNFGPMGPGGPQMMNNMGPGPGPMNGPRNMGNNGPNNRHNQSWVHGGAPKNFRDNDSWRSSGPGNNNGVCKAYMRGNCNSQNCKYIHPKSRR